MREAEGDERCGVKGRRDKEIIQVPKRNTKVGGFLTKSRRGEVFKGERIITKRRERLERGEGKKEL